MRDLLITTENTEQFREHFRITNGKILRTARKLLEKHFLVTAIRMNQPCWVLCGKRFAAEAEAWSDEQIVQQAVGQLPWGHNLVMQIETRLLECEGTAVDRQIKADEDQPTIGLLLCKSKNKVVAEYALGDKTQPMGIAEYKLQQSLPEPLETNLPSIEQIERELQGEKS